jgi:hypothetical protein
MAYSNSLSMSMPSQKLSTKPSKSQAMYVICMVGHRKQYGDHAKLARRSNSSYGARDYDVTRISLVNRSIGRR